MRKRLQYAMPRVPLVKLWQRNNDVTEGETGDPTGAGETMVGAMAKRIQQANKAREIAPKKGKVPLGGDIEHDQPDSGDESHFDQTQVEHSVFQAAEVDERCLGTELCILIRKGQNICVHDQHFNIDQEDMDTMNRLVAKIERQNEGKNLKLVLVEGDSDNIVAGNKRKTKNKKEDERPNECRMNEVSSANKGEVEALVHHEDHKNVDVLQDYLPKSKAQDFRFEEFVMNPAGGAKPKQLTTMVRGKKHTKAGGRQN